MGNWLILPHVVQSGMCLFDTYDRAKIQPILDRISDVNLCDCLRKLDIIDKQMLNCVSIYRVDVKLDISTEILLKKVETYLYCSYGISPDYGYLDSGFSVLHHTLGIRKGIANYEINTHLNWNKADYSHALPTEDRQVFVQN